MDIDPSLANQSGEVFRALSRRRLGSSSGSITVAIEGKVRERMRTVREFARCAEVHNRLGPLVACDSH